MALVTNLVTQIQKIAFSGSDGDVLRCELETRLSRRLTRRASAEPLRFGIVNALKCEPVHVLDAGCPRALARMEQT